VRRVVRFFLSCFCLLLLLITVEAIAGWRCDLKEQIPTPVPSPKERQAAVHGIKDYSRPEVDTYLSLPEWYIVWSYQEKADFQQSGLPSRFPYFGEVRQYWSIFCCISRLTKGKYPSNTGEEIAQVVIGTSFSAEYILKGLYEETIGRLSEWTSGHQFTEEDQYASKVARDYADFVHIRPFYEFPFAHSLKGLWTENPLWGAHLVRKYERRAFLSLDYAIEGVYSWVIEQGTHLSYGFEPAETYAWIDNVDVTILPQIPRIRVVKQVGPAAFVVSIPRYQEFTPVASSMAQRGVHFVEIAGNSSVTLSALAPQGWHSGPDAQQLFSLPVLIRSGSQRIFLRCDVPALDQTLNRLRTDGVTVEHIYDY
jgi:hypothetical protein